MFIFSSNSTKYVFEYKVSKLFPVNLKDKITLSPSVFQVEVYRSIQNFSSDYINDGVVVGLAVSDFTLRNLTVSQTTKDTVILSTSVSDFSLRNLVISNQFDDKAVIGIGISDVSLLNLTINQGTGDTAVLSLSISDFNLT